MEDSFIRVPLTGATVMKVGQKFKKPGYSAILELNYADAAKVMDVGWGDYVKCHRPGEPRAGHRPEFYEEPVPYIIANLSNFDKDYDSTLRTLRHAGERHFVLDLTLVRHKNQDSKFPPTIHDIDIDQFESQLREFARAGR